MNENLSKHNKTIIPEKVLSALTIAQSLLLSVYGICALLLRKNLRAENLYSLSQIGKPIHLCFICIIVLGLFLIVYRIITEGKQKGFYKNPLLIVPFIVTAANLLFSQANSIYTMTQGGTFEGLLNYSYSNYLSGNNPIENFMYGSATLPKYVFVILLGLACAAVIGFVLKQTPLSDISFGSVDTDALKQTASSATAAGKEYLNKVAGNSSVLKKVLIPLLIVLILAGGFAVYKEFFEITKFDLSSFTSDITVTGYDGEAVAQPPKVDYDKLYDYDPDQTYFLKDVLATVEYSVYPSEGLSNGDMVTVEAIYDEALAKKNKIKLTNLTWQAEVTDAIVRVTASDITPQILTAVKDRADAKVRKEIQDHNPKNISCECVASYFLSGKESWSGMANDQVVLVFDVSFDGSYWSFMDEQHYDIIYYAWADYITDANNVDGWSLRIFDSNCDTIEEVNDYFANYDKNYQVTQLE